MKIDFEKMVLPISLLVFVVFFFFGFLAGNNYYSVQKRKMVSLKEAQKREETKKIEKFLQMIKQEQ